MEQQILTQRLADAELEKDTVRLMAVAARRQAVIANIAAHKSKLGAEQSESFSMIAAGSAGDANASALLATIAQVRFF